MAVVAMNTDQVRHSAWDLFWIFLRLGCTSFGGPVAHLAFFRHEFVDKRGWLDDKQYMDLVALCQFLPGPTSSQVGMGLGLRRAGLMGGVAAWLGFTLPSAVIMIAFALGLGLWKDTVSAGLLHGLKIAAVAVVAQAVWSMGRSLCPDRARQSLAVAAAIFALMVPTAWGQLAGIVLGAIVGAMLYRTDRSEQDRVSMVSSRVSWMLSAVAGGLFLLLLIVPSVVALEQSAQAWSLFDAFYRTGSLVFGGGHVALPLLQSEVVVPGWVDAQTFLAGYGLAQAVPGPLFSIAGFLGAAASAGPGGVLGGLLCLLAVFLPAFLLLVAALPHWERLSQARSVQSALKGVNAAVVGLLLAAFYDPVWNSAVRQVLDFSLVLLAFLALTQWRVPPWLLVLGCALAGWLLL